MCHARDAAAYRRRLANGKEIVGMVEEIKALKELLDMDAITQEEYDLKKREILDQSSRAAAPVAVASTPTPPQCTSASQVPQGKSKVAAGLLAIFLGGLGVHKFYLGYTTQGVILLLMTILGTLLLIGPLVTGIISLIEGIIYLTKSDEDFYNIYVANKKEWF